MGREDGRDPGEEFVGYSAGMSSTSIESMKSRLLLNRFAYRSVSTFSSLKNDTNPGGVGNAGLYGLSQWEKGREGGKAGKVRDKREGRRRQKQKGEERRDRGNSGRDFLVSMESERVRTLLHSGTKTYRKSIHIPLQAIHHGGTNSLWVRLAFCNSRSNLDRLDQSGSLRRKRRHTLEHRWPVSCDSIRT